MCSSVFGRNAGIRTGASWTRTKRDTKLRHVPIDAFSLYYFFLESQGHYQILEQGMFNRILERLRHRMGADREECGGHDK